MIRTVEHDFAAIVDCLDRATPKSAAQVPFQQQELEVPIKGALMTLQHTDKLATRKVSM